MNAPNRKPQTVEAVLDEMDEREAWRPALIAFWKIDGCLQRAENLRRGEPFDYLDIRTIDAIEAALAEVREAA